MGGVFVDIPVKNTSTSVDAELKPSVKQRTSSDTSRLPKGSSYQAQSNRERIVLRKLQKDLDLIDSQKRIVINAVEQELHQSVLPGLTCPTLF